MKNMAPIFMLGTNSTTFDTSSDSTSFIYNKTVNLTTERDYLKSTQIYTTNAHKILEITWDDATWILTSSFIIFTMQSGFGLLEAGSVSSKNEVNIMVKNAVDVIFGGLTYWAFGYGLALGTAEGSTPFYGIGEFAVDSTPETMGAIHATFIFQLSFATTATTIVSGAMAERTKLNAYIVFSLLNTIVYCLPAHWLWASNGFLYTMGVIDLAGSGGVHLVGGTSGLVATVLLKPRLGKYSKVSEETDEEFKAGNPTNCLVGMFMLWWGWLGFNCGSTFGISGGKWKMAAKSAVTTILGSMGGGLSGLTYSYIFRSKIFSIPDLVNSILGALVSVTASCALIKPWESILVGICGALLVIIAADFFEKIHIDDPVGAISVHGVGGIWGMIVVGLLVENDPVENYDRGNTGLFKGGGIYLLSVQLLACLCIIVWSGAITFILLIIIRGTIGLRMSEEEEALGADYVEHRVGIYSLPLHLQSTSPQGTPPRRISTSFSDIKSMENGAYVADYEADFGTHINAENLGSEIATITSSAVKRSSYGFKAVRRNSRDNHVILPSADATSFTPGSHGHTSAISTISEIGNT